MYRSGANVGGHSTKPAGSLSFTMMRSGKYKLIFFKGITSSVTFQELTRSWKGGSGGEVDYQPQVWRVRRYTPDRMIASYQKLG